MTKRIIYLEPMLREHNPCVDESVEIDTDIPLEEQFGGEYLDRVQRALTIIDILNYPMNCIGINRQSAEWWK